MHHVDIDAGLNGTSKCVIAGTTVVESAGPRSICQAGVNQSLRK
jgi:hypothetical protein